ncbi:MAG: fimbrillin family protein [Bacteroidales bacterium]|nr:fimbrillin family protein [Bacteroidales bacterium]
MNKYLFSLPLMAVAFGGMITSCSNDDTLIEGTANANGQEIEFTLDINSRGNDVTTENLDSIWVYAYSGSGSTATERIPLTKFVRNDYDVFKPETPIYWQSEWGESLTFNAFGPDRNAKCTPSGNPSGGKSYGFVKPTTTTPGALKVQFEHPQLTGEQIDQIVATKTVSKQDSRAGIPLVFQHIYSKIDLKVVKSDDSEYDIDVYGAGLYITNSAKTAITYNFSSNSTTTATTSSGVLYLAVVDNNTPIAVSSEPKYVDGNNATYFITPQTLEGTQYNPLVEPKGPRASIFLYSKVYDKKGNLLYPTEHDLTVSDRLAGAGSALINACFTKTDWLKIGKSRIAIAPKMEFKAGHHYQVTLDLTKGIGYFSGGDPERPNEPVLNPELGVMVEVQEWVDGNLVNIEVNQGDGTTDQTN